MSVSDSMKKWITPALAAMIACALPAVGFSAESDIPLPELAGTTFNILGNTVNGRVLLMIGLVVCILGALFGILQAFHMKSMPAHKSMLEVSELIYSTCKTYLFTQAKLLAILEVLIGLVIFVYFYFLNKMPIGTVLLILMWSVIGILGSFAVAWFGMRINTYANSRAAFSSLRGKPLPVLRIPLQAGMSIGMLLISLELVLMLIILLFVNKDIAGACFLGFAIGESLGASVLRICGGIFTKIADIGSDLMKIVFGIKEDDARNPGVIADCVGDNAGDSVGPTADGFETYGVTGVALITFIALAVTGAQLQATLLIWLFVMRIMMILTSLFSYYVNDAMTKAKYSEVTRMDFEAPLHKLVILTSVVSIIFTYLVSYLLLSSLTGEQSNLWWVLSTIISCGTVAGALIPILTMAFTSLKSKHVSEIVDSTREGGASLTILSGLVAGNFSAFWMGLAITGLMAVAYLVSTLIGQNLMDFQSVFAFGLVAFGFLGMGPVTIAVDSYGPVTDNAQSIYELSMIETIPNIAADVKSTFGFEPSFESSKEFLEENDGAGNTFKATAKPVLIGTAVVGATTMIFSLILMLTRGDHAVGKMEDLAITNPLVLLGMILGGAVVYWFTGASMQAVTTGAYRAVEFIKRNIKLEEGAGAKASVADSQKVVEICTKYAQTGMINIFCAIFFFALAFAFMNPFLFIGYLISIALFGLFQAIFMANAGGAWDNAKKLVEVTLKEKGSPLHDATVIGDTVGDPFKDTSSVALNPIIKFTTLFGILAVELAVKVGGGKGMLPVSISAVLLLIALVFVYRSFYNMRIKSA